MGHPLERRKITAKGILLPSEWDDNGAVLALTFFTHDEDEYKVKGKELMPELLGVLRQELFIEGYLRWEEGEKMIQITAFSPFGIL
ncbi:MAG: hypothetical protein LJE96_13105 [Deltaproteobacteria bacterium]|jgi:hypothetical protein|nr:hypothetical protein [Deltaproteobacteria bacterium]